MGYISVLCCVCKGKVNIGYRLFCICVAVVDKINNQRCSQTDAIIKKLFEWKFLKKMIYHSSDTATPVNSDNIQIRNERVRDKIWQCSDSFWTSLFRFVPFLNLTCSVRLLVWECLLKMVTVAKLENILFYVGISVGCILSVFVIVVRTFPYI